MTKIEFANEISENLRELAKTRGIAQRELSRRTGINSSLINKYFNGKALPSFKNVITICHVLGCELSEIVTIRDKVE